MSEVYISIDEALALAASLSKIPEGFTAEEILDALIEEAEANYENRNIDGDNTRLSSTALQLRKEVCITRYNLYALLKESVDIELRDDSSCPFKTIVNAGGKISIDPITFSFWIFRDFGIDYPVGKYYDILDSNGLPRNTEWEDITITLSEIDLISLSYKDGKPIKKSFFDVGLADRRNNTPNTEAGILIGLSSKLKFPVDEIDANYAKRLMHSLRKSLSAFTGIQSDPFKSKSPDSGWLPKFKLINRANSKNIRDLKEILMADHRSSYNFVKMPDDAQNWIDENESLPKGQRSKII